MPLWPLGYGKPGPFLEFGFLEINPERLRKWTTKFTSANSKICYVFAVPYQECKEWIAKIIDPKEVARFEPPHLDLCCLQIHLF